MTEPAEEARLRKGLGRDHRLRVRADLIVGQTPAEQLLAARPDVLILGTGLPGLNLIEYLDAARQNLPDCVLCLLCDRGQAEAVRPLRPHVLLQRPVSLTELLTALEAVTAARVLPASASPPCQPASPALQSDLLRLDDMVPDPLLLLNAAPLSVSPSGPEPGLPAEGVAAAPSGEKNNTKSAQSRTVSGQLHQAVTFPERSARADVVEGKVAVDPSVYQDALADIDVDALGDEEPALAPPAVALSRPPSTPPPLPADVGTAVRRRSEPPALPPPLPKETPPPSRRSAPPVPLPSEGDLATTDPPTLVGRLCTTGYTGCLELQPPGEEGSRRCLFFDGGEVVAVSSTLPIDSLPEILYHEGRLSREQLKRARHLLAEQGASGEMTNRRLAQKLADEQILPRGEVVPLLRRQVIEIFYRSLAWDKGRYRLLPRTAPPEDRVRLKETPKLLLLEGLRRKASLDNLIQRVGPDDTVLQPVMSGSLLLKDAGITAFEQRALPLFDGHHSLLQISRQSGLAEHATYVLAYALMCLGGLRRPSEGRPAPPPSAPAGEGKPGNQPPPAVKEEPSRDSEAQAELEATRERVRRKHAQVLEGDYFSLLDLAETASAEEIRRAYAALRIEFSDDLLPSECRSELAAELGQIREVLGEAFAVLSNDQMREAYRAHLLPEVHRAE